MKIHYWSPQFNNRKHPLAWKPKAQSPREIILRPTRQGLRSRTCRADQKSEHVFNDLMVINLPQNDQFPHITLAKVASNRESRPISSKP